MTDAFAGLASIISDSHVHVGHFLDGKYYSPEYVFSILEDLGIKRWVVSSTSTLTNNANTVQQELNKLIMLAPQKTIPLLWVTQEMFNSAGDFIYDDAIPYRGFKIHPYGNLWREDDPKLRYVFSLASKRDWPVLLHTGWTPESEAARFQELFSSFRDVVVLLAHGRPLDQAIKMTRTYDNAFIEASFMPLGDIREVSLQCGNDKIVFGSDLPIDQHYYPKQSVRRRYRQRINALVKCFGESTVVKWGNENFEKIFC